MNFYPLQNRILVRKIDADQVTKGGVYIPDTAKEKPMEGEVIAIAVGLKIDLKAGDRVVFGKYAGTEIKVDGETLLVLKDEDIIGRFA